MFGRERKFFFSYFGCGLFSFFNCVYIIIMVNSYLHTHTQLLNVRLFSFSSFFHSFVLSFSFINFLQTKKFFHFIFGIHSWINQAWDVVWFVVWSVWVYYFTDWSYLGCLSYILCIIPFVTSYRNSLNSFLHITHINIDRRQKNCISHLDTT